MTTKQTNVKLVTAAVFVATFMTAVEGTIVTTAMPTIVGSLHGIEIMNWVFSIYLLTNAMLTPIYGKLADRIGRKAIFIFGTLLFIIGSALCGFSDTMLTLIVARGIQGMGAGAMMPVALTIIGDLYSMEKRARVLGLNSTAWGIASVVGPLAGGIIVDTVGWHWIFFINVPIGILLIWMIWQFLAEPRRRPLPVGEKTVPLAGSDESGGPTLAAVAKNEDSEGVAAAARPNKPMDIAGSLFLMLTLLSLLLAFQFLGDHGFDLTVGLLLAGFVLGLVLFVFTEKRAQDPVISMELFTSRLFVVVNLVAALGSGFLMAVDVYIPMWMQGVLGLPAGIGGLVLAPLSVLWMVGSFLAGRWLVRHSVKSVLLTGLLITLLGGASLFLIPMAASWLWFFAISTILGIGLGAVTVTCTVSAQSSVPHEQLGVATSFNTLARTIGQTIMVSVFGILMNGITAAQLSDNPVTNDPDIMNKLVNPQTAKLLPTEQLEPLRKILFAGLHGVFGGALCLIAAALVLTVVIRDKSGTIEDESI